MPAMKSRKVSKPTRSDYTPQTAAPLDPNAVSELRFKLLNAGSPVPAVHALAHSCFENSIFSPVIYENLPDKYQANYHQNYHLNWLIVRK